MFTVLVRDAIAPKGFHDPLASISIPGDAVATVLFERACIVSHHRGWIERRLSAPAHVKRGCVAVFVSDAERECIPPASARIGERTY